MINPKRLAKMVRKWRQAAAIGRRRIYMAKTDVGAECMDGIADKGHFVVYAHDGKRFVVPLAYLNCLIFKELLKMGEEEFGLMANKPITLPCDAIFMEYIVSMLKREMPMEVEKALLVSITTICNRNLPSTSLYHGPNHQQQGFLIHGF